jgi:hypothetical protein
LICGNLAFMNAPKCMRWVVVVVAAGLLGGWAAAAEPAAKPPGIVGTWKLVRYEDQPPEGPKQFPLGEHPVGQLIYTADGHMSIQLMKVPHPKIASGDDTKVTPEEKQALFDAYVAYFGKYRVDEKRHVVIHDVEADYADVFIGKSEERPYLLEGDVLKLVPTWTQDGKTWKGVREFVRAR